MRLLFDLQNIKLKEWAVPHSNKSQIVTKNCQYCDIVIPNAFWSRVETLDATSTLTLYHKF